MVVIKFGVWIGVAAVAAFGAVSVLDAATATFVCGGVALILAMRRHVLSDSTKQQVQPSKAQPPRRSESSPTV